MDREATELRRLVERALGMADGLGATEAALRLDQARLSLMEPEAAVTEARLLIEELGRSDRVDDPGRGVDPAAPTA